VEGKEAFPNFFRVVFPEDIRRAHSPLSTQGVESDEPAPGFVSAKEIQRGTPPTPIQIHAPGLHCDWRRRAAIGLRRFELIAKMGFQVFCPILEPNVQGREGKKFFDEQEEGGEWILLHLHSRVPAPLSRTSVEGADSFFGKKRDHRFRLAKPVLPISRLHIGVIPNDCPEVRTMGAWVALESRHGMGIGLSE